MEARAGEHHAGLVPVANRGRQFVHQARLAHAGFGPDVDDVALPGRRRLPTVTQMLALLVTSDHHEGTRRADIDVEMLFLSHSHRSPQTNRVREPLELVRAQILALADGAKQRAGRVRDHHLVGRRHRLGPGREIGRLTDDCFLFRGTLSHQITRHHHAGCDPDAHADPNALFSHREIGRSNRVHGGKSRSHRPFWSVLVRGRVPEQGQNAVAHVPRHGSPEMMNPLGGSALVCAQKLGEHLRVEPLR